MTDSGWDFYRNECWHYQLFDSKKFPIIEDVSKLVFFFMHFFFPSLVFWEKRDLYCFDVS